MPVSHAHSLTDVWISESAVWCHVTITSSLPHHYLIVDLCACQCYLIVCASMVINHLLLSAGRKALY